LHDQNACVCRNFMLSSSLPSSGRRCPSNIFRHHLAFNNRWTCRHLLSWTRSHCIYWFVCLFRRFNTSCWLTCYRWGLFFLLSCVRLFRSLRPVNFHLIISLLAPTASLVQHPVTVRPSGLPLFFWAEPTIPKPSSWRSVHRRLRLVFLLLVRVRPLLISSCSASGCPLVTSSRIPISTVADHFPELLLTSLLDLLVSCSSSLATASRRLRGLQLLLRWLLTVQVLQPCSALLPPLSRFATVTTSRVRFSLLDLWRVHRPIMPTSPSIFASVPFLPVWVCLPFRMALVIIFCSGLA
ncbi:hypothetical protein GN958_ATG17205, partial [Phytophthora infestans]